jgi:hypothetical protein
MHLNKRLHDRSAGILLHSESGMSIGKIIIRAYFSKEVNIGIGSILSYLFLGKVCNGWCKNKPTEITLVQV